MARNYANYNFALSQIENIFNNSFFIENNEDLNKIHFCFKIKLTNDDYAKTYNHNLKIFQENLDLSLIENDFKRILSKIVNMDDLKK